MSAGEVSRAPQLINNVYLGIEGFAFYLNSASQLDIKIVYPRQTNTCRFLNLRPPFSYMF